MQALEQPPLQEPDNDASNSLSSASFLGEFVHRKSVIKTGTIAKTAPVEDKLKNIKYELFTSLSLMTPKRLRPMELRNQLRNHQYERVERKKQSEALHRFGKEEHEIFREQQHLIMVLSSVMRGFRADKSHSFYIVTKKSTRVLYFHHRYAKEAQKIESTLNICNIGEAMAVQLDNQKIPYEKLYNEDCEKLVIKNHAISIFWGRLLNQIIDSDEKHYRSFNIVANFEFAGSLEAVPIELFNGLDNRKQYSFVADPTPNLLGETVEEVYRLKIAGVWTLKNVTNLMNYLQSAFKSRHHLEFQVDRVSVNLYDDQAERTAIIL